MQLRERLAYAGVVNRPRPPQPRDLRAPEGFSRGLNRLGQVYYHDRFLGLDHRHGRVRLSAALSLNTGLLERLADGVSQEHVRRAAFLDIETTGLSGGTGTYAFLVGVGTFDGLSFRVRQFFLADPAGEAAMLAAVAETVDRCDAIVTYNGKSFDIPQLNTRYVLSRLPPLAEDLPHVDLLHPCRRLFGRVLDSCRLAEIERELLGLHRYGEPPSWMIPELYFAYVRRRDLGGLHPVFEHNHLDVVSLVALLAHLDTVAGLGAPADAAGLVALARWDEQRHRPGEARESYEAAWRLDRKGEAGATAVIGLARLLRRLGDWEGHQDVWREELQTSGSPARRARAGEELAKVAEHREQRPAKALRLASQALTTLRDSGSPMPLTEARLQYRLRRLERKVADRAESQGVGTP